MWEDTLTQVVVYGIFIVKLLAGFFFVMFGLLRVHRKNRIFFYLIGLANAFSALTNFLLISLEYNDRQNSNLSALEAADKYLWVGYLDWIVTTPMVIVDLGLLCHIENYTLFALVLVDEMMIISGYIACVVVMPFKIVWFLLGAAFFVILFSIMIIQHRMNFIKTQKYYQLQQLVPENTPTNISTTTNISNINKQLGSYSTAVRRSSVVLSKSSTLVITNPNTNNQQQYQPAVTNDIELTLLRGGWTVFNKQLSTRLIILTLVSWTVYPIIWLLTQMGENYLSISGGETIHIVLSLVSKVSFGIILAINRATIPERLKKMRSQIFNNSILPASTNSVYNSNVGVGWQDDTVAVNTPPPSLPNQIN